MGTETTRTFETRICIDPYDNDLLHSCAQLFSKIRHRLFADIASGKTSGELKKDYLVRYKITARHFNAIRVEVEGKIASIKKRVPQLIAETKESILSLQLKIKKLCKANAKAELIHQKKRRLNGLNQKLHRLQEDNKNGVIRCCFGSKKLFRAQFHLEESGYTSHEEWRKEWEKSRKREFFFLGSKDETAGNQTCTATLNADHTLQLRLRLPDALAKRGKYLLISNVSFNYGRQEIIDLLKDSNSRAISWRFLHDEKGWRVFATFDIKTPPCITPKNCGVIGLDINSDHLALVETDRFGNPLSKKVIPLNLYGKSSTQTRALIGDAAAATIAYAEIRHKPLILEDLNFQKKKAALRENNRTSHARMLSSFAYGSLITHLKSRAVKIGVLIEQVNPAYTSLIGRVKFAKRYGLSIHQAAALAIGRRYLHFSEKPPSSLKEIPDGKGDHVTLSLPARNRGRHVWSLWSQLSKKLRAALAAHFRTAKGRSKSSHMPAFETGSISEVVSENPTRESSEALLA